MERRLTAILAADVAGYSRLMEADENGTYTALQSHLETCLRPAIERHNGRIVKLMGDGVLAAFASVVDAVDAATDIQTDMRARTGDQSADRRIAFRIGVHLGDVISEGDDIHGDGVNLAARLESLATPGTICLSQQALDQVGGHLRHPLRDLGPQQVKNLSRPVQAWLLDPTGSGTDLPRPHVPSVRRRGAMRPVLAGLALVALVAAGMAYLETRSGNPPQVTAAQPVRQASALPALAVLPFDNLSGDDAQDYLTDGITDDLITDLAKVSGLLVIARESSFAFKGAAFDPAQVAGELGVRYLVQGSMRRAGDRIRINAQLIDTDSGAHVWAERYDREMRDIFALQDDVRSRIVEALKVKLTPDEAKSLARTLTDNPDAYDAYLRARQQESFFTRDSTHEAIRLYHQALERDPDFVVAKARLATAYTMLADSGWANDIETSLSLALSLAKEAAAKDSRLPLAYWALSRVYTRKEYFDEAKAIESLEQAIRIDPNYADAYAMLANTLHFTGRSEEGLAHIETAMRLNPRFPFWYYFTLGANQFHLTRYEAAEASFLKAIERNPRWQSSHRYLVSTYGHLDRPDDAEWEMEELRALGFDPSMDNFRAIAKYSDLTYEARFFEGLRKAGVPEN